MSYNNLCFFRKRFTPHNRRRYKYRTTYANCSSSLYGCCVVLFKAKCPEIFVVNTLLRNDVKFILCIIKLKNAYLLYVKYLSLSI